MIIRAKAPLRLGLAGGGTDVPPYCDQYGGYVLNATIDMYAYCTIKTTDDCKISFYAADIDEYFESPSESMLDIDGALRLHKGVYNRVMQMIDAKRLSFKMTTYSDAPPGSGLGSSSTMVVAMLKAFQEWLDLPLGEYDLARLAYEIERIDIGLSGGKQDQYAATFGGVNFMEFYAKDHVIVNPLRIKNWIMDELQSSLILYYTGTSRDSEKIIDDQIRSISNNDNQSIEGMHELKMATKKMKEALLKGDFEVFAECLNKGWESKKKTSSSISNTEIDKIYNYIMQNGGRAAKISGAGGGGFMMIICDPTKKYSLVKSLQQMKGFVMPATFTQSGTKAWRLY